MMSVTPITSKHRAHRPPAMMPVPLGAGCISTDAAPCLPMTGGAACLGANLHQLATRFVHGLLHGDRHFARLALAHAADAAVTIAHHGQRVAKLRIRPPFTTL